MIVFIAFAAGRILKYPRRLFRFGIVAPRLERIGVFPLAVESDDVRDVLALCARSTVGIVAHGPIRWTCPRSRDGRCSRFGIPIIGDVTGPRTTGIPFANVDDE